MTADNERLQLRKLQIIGAIHEQSQPRSENQRVRGSSPWRRTIWPALFLLGKCIRIWCDDLVMTSVPTGSGYERRRGLRCCCRDRRIHACVRVAGKRDRRMTEGLLHDLEIDAGGEHQRRRTVAQIVQPHRGQISHPHQLMETVGDRGRVQWFPVLAGEHFPRIHPR